MPENTGAYGAADATEGKKNEASVANHDIDGTDASLNARVKQPRTGKPPYWLWIAIIAVIAIVVGIGVVWTNRSDKQSGTAAGRSDAVTIGLKLAPTNLDIRNQSGSTLDQILIGNVYEGLVARNQKNKVVAGLAKSWTISDDGLTYRFKINDGITFSNGDELDAEDVAWSINELRDKQYQDAEVLDSVQSVEADPKSNEFTMTLSKPDANLLWNLTGRAGLVFDKDAHYDAKTEAIGSGPYLLKEFRANDSIVLKANSDYWGAHKAKTDTVTLRFFTDDNAAVNALKAGDVQVLAPISETLAAPFKRDTDNYTVKAGGGTDKFVLAMNGAEGKATADKRVRQAIRYAIDHKELIASRGGVDKALGGPIPSLDPGYEDLTDLYPHDVSKAKQLMEQVGYSPDNPLKLTLTYANTYGTELGDQLRSQLKTIGIDLKVNVVEFSTWLQDVHSDKNYDLSLVDHNESHDFYQWANPDYYYNYDNPEVQRLYAEAIAQPDADASDALLARAARIVSEDAAADWLFNYRVTTAVAKGVEGFPFDMNQTLLPLWNVTYRR